MPLLLLVLAWATALAAPARNDWYRHSLCNIHIDNHSGLVARGVSVDDLAAMFSTVPVSMIQVSGQSNGPATYPTAIDLNNPAAKECDNWRAQSGHTGGMNVCLAERSPRCGSRLD